MLGTFKEAAVFVSFKLNQSYIAKNLCVERDNPESTCHGCCQLKEKLAETREQEQNVPVPEKQQKETSTIVLFWSIYPFFSFSKNLGVFQPMFEYLTNHYKFLSANDFFRPPKMRRLF